MVVKVQVLQRRLIAKTEEVVEKDLLIQVRRLTFIHLALAGWLAGTLECGRTGSACRGESCLPASRRQDHAA
jgi:hypothetical protein